MNRRNAARVSIAVFLFTTYTLGAACADSKDPMRDDDAGPVQPPGTAVHQITPAALREIAGVDALPQLLNAPELAESMKRHYPGQLRGKGTAGSVLVDVSIDAHGNVTSVAPQPAPTVEARALRGTRPDVARLPAEAATDASTAQFGGAARAALMAARFSPAIRDGKPVAFTLRMTVRFTDPDSPINP